MVFGLILILLFAGITYFHYVQGGFTSAMSAMSALIATLVAFGYYETAVGMIPRGSMIDSVAGMVLIALFGVVYIILRVIFDSAIPGNIRLPLWVDRACAVVFGLFAALLAVGTFSVGAQLLPFGPSIGGYARYELRDRSVTIPKDSAGSGARSDIDAQIRDEMVADKLDPSAKSSPYLPADEFVVSLVSTVSGGAFAGDRDFSKVHPDLLTEAFASRLGADNGFTRVLLNNSSENGVKLAKEGLFMPVPHPVGFDGEVPRLRPNGDSIVAEKSSSLKLLIVRVEFDHNFGDPDGNLRITPAASRLVIGTETFYPVGVMDQNGKLGLTRIDDQIIVSFKNNGAGADFAYSIDANALDKAAPGGKFKPDSAFIEFKLFGRINLSGKEISANWTPTPRSNVLRKKASPLYLPPALPAAAK